MSLLNMLSTLKLGSVINQRVARCISPASQLIKSTNSLGSNKTSVPKYIHSSAVCNASHFKARDRRDLLKSVAKRDDGTEGEKMVSLDAKILSREDMFTDENTPDLLFNGVPFRELPIVTINVSKNNTKIALTDYKGTNIVYRTPRMEGFKNCRKGTNVAGQTTAVHVSSKGVRMGIKDVRVVIGGLGPGRMASIKGLEMGGLNIISITDSTRVSFKPSYRPRKARRL